MQSSYGNTKGCVKSLQDIDPHNAQLERHVHTTLTSPEWVLRLFQSSCLNSFTFSAWASKRCITQIFKALGLMRHWNIKTWTPVHLCCSPTLNNSAPSVIRLSGVNKSLPNTTHLGPGTYVGLFFLNCVVAESIFEGWLPKTAWKFHNQLNLG